MIHLAATVGDPASIGPEVAFRALSEFFKTHNDVVVTLFYPPELARSFLNSTLKLAQTRARLNLKSPAKIPAAKRPGVASARYALASLESAVSLCAHDEADALVTGPVDKNLCAQILPGFSGHTEYLQKKMRAARTTMFLRAKDIAVGLVTTHIPLARVSSALTKAKIINTTTDVYSHLRAFVRSPRIGICALNPHASDRGLLGSEEARIIVPAVKSLQKKFGSTLSGPWPADTIFWRRRDFDAIICMYHDQGLIPLKMSAFDEAVNITLGLPFLRTSVDHGTAFDLVGTGKASYTSYLEALEYAYKWCQSNNRNSGRKRAQS